MSLLPPLPPHDTKSSPRMSAERRYPARTSAFTLSSGIWVRPTGFLCAIGPRKQWCRIRFQENHNFMVVQLEASIVHLRSLSGALGSERQSMLRADVKPLPTNLPHWLLVRARAARTSESSESPTWRSSGCASAGAYGVRASLANSAFVVLLFGAFLDIPWPSGGFALETEPGAATDRKDQARRRTKTPQKKQFVPHLRTGPHSPKGQSQQNAAPPPSPGRGASRTASVQIRTRVQTNPTT